MVIHHLPTLAFFGVWALVAVENHGKHFHKIELLGRTCSRDASLPMDKGKHKRRRGPRTHMSRLRFTALQPHCCCQPFHLRITTHEKSYWNTLYAFRDVIREKKTLEVRGKTTTHALGKPIGKSDDRRRVNKHILLLLRLSSANNSQSTQVRQFV